jgi:hypothetical protein
MTFVGGVNAIHIPILITNVIEVQQNSLKIFSHSVRLHKYQVLITKEYIMECTVHRLVTSGQCLFHVAYVLTLNFKASILKGSDGVSISLFLSVAGDDGNMDVIPLVLRVTPFELAAKPLVPFRKPLL